MKTTPAMLRALFAIKAGKVWQVYNDNGNTFRRPRGVGVSTLRKLETLRWFEDEPGQKGGRYKLQLSKRGRLEIGIRS